MKHNDLLEHDLDLALQAAKGHQARAERFKTELNLILDCIDYTAGACKPIEMVGAVLPLQIIEQAKKALESNIGVAATKDCQEGMRGRSMPRYLFDAIKNAYTALAHGDIPRAITILKFIIEEVESGSYKLIDS